MKAEKNLAQAVIESPVSEARPYVLVCEGAHVRFPLIAPRNRWRLLFRGPRGPWHEALRGVTLKVPKGEIIGVIGRNGAGKSTLLRTLAGVYELSSGKVVRGGPVSALFELGGMGGMLITGIQYIQRWLRLNGVPKRKWPSFIQEIRDFSELGDRLEDRIFTYSAGMAARLYFATATSVSRDIYLIDEVLAVGDEHFQAKCWKRIRERLAKGVSGVLVTHDWSAILRLCETALEIEAGKVVNEGNAEEVICKYLNLAAQLDPHAAAKFGQSCPTHTNAVSGADWRCEIPVTVAGDSPIFLSYSIEKLILGHDWQILILGADTMVAGESGDFTVTLVVPDLPLPGGDYRVNLFLTGPRPADGGPKPIFDMRSWTSGSSLRLHVAGPMQTGLVCIPLIDESQ